LSTPAPSAVSPALATASTPVCWDESATGKALCASSFSALAQDAFTTYGIVFSSGSSVGLNKDETALINGSKTAQSLSAMPLSVTVQPNSAQTTWIMGVVYMDKNYGGAYSVTTTAPSSLTSDPCKRAGSLNFGYEQESWPNIRNDNAESVATIPGCKIRMFADTNFSGTAIGWIASKPDLGAFDNQASSWEYEGGF
jgi:hypothetical protein